MNDWTQQSIAQSITLPPPTCYRSTVHSGANTFPGHADCTDTLCAYSKESVVKFSSLDKSASYDDGEGEAFATGELFDGNTTEKCPKSFKYCYALWQEDYLNKNFTTILAQGCWDSAGEFDCSVGECISNKRPPKALNNTKFCCCLGNKCNVNVSDGYFDPVICNPEVVHASYDAQTVIIAISTMCSLAVIIMVAACITCHMCSTSQKSSPDSVHLMEAPPPSTPTFDLESLKIQENVGRGRYGSVFHGTLYNHSVAVKVFSSQNRQNYMNERDIYCLPFMDHPCLPKFIGAEEHTTADGKPEYLLVLSYAPQGCLQDYLSHQTVDWPTFCKMAHTITQGLAHLHTEIRKAVTDKLKMCIAHRDLTSRNILIKGDGSCVLCDFGFAIRISGSKYYMNGEELVAEATSLADVGTLRYMAPEVLEGAVNLRDCESSLKQIDVYALGLIMWEIATRCVDLFQGVEVPEYKLPFEAEIGLHPSMEQMQVLVARHKARPLFPDIWKDTNPAVRALKETTEDCWDQDAEARLTALCVEERLIELPVLWDRYKAGSTVHGVSPTVNPTSSQTRAATSYPVQSAANTWYKGPVLELPVINTNAESLSPNNRTGSNRHSRECISSSSDNTAETSITLSPCELTPKSCPSSSSSNSNNIKNFAANNIAVSCPKVTVPLQPHQGRNPCLERNLMMDPVEEVAISGNSIIEKGEKYRDTNRSAHGSHTEVDLFNSFQPSDTTESNALVPNDVLNHTARACNPIPYVQNAVHITSTMPKQPNVPGNGHTLHASTGQSAESKRDGSEKRKSSNGHSFRLGLKNLFRFQRNSDEPHTREQPSISSIKSKSNIPVSQVTVQKLFKADNTATKYNLVDHNDLDIKPKQCVETEVYILDPDTEFSMTQTVVRPVANKQVYCNTSAKVAEELVQPAETHRDNKHCSLMNGFVQGQTHPCSYSQPNSSTNCKLFNNTSSNRTKRPNTLPVSGLENCNNSDLATEIDSDELLEKVAESLPQCSNVDNNKGRDKTKRIKTPFQLKKDRFSLYDDRIMTCNFEPSQQLANESTGLKAGQISASVPLDIDSLCKSEASSFMQTCQNSTTHASEEADDQQQEPYLL